VNIHERVTARSIALHREVARRLCEEPALLQAARLRVAGWLADGSVAREYAEAWSTLLASPLERVVEALTDPSERMHDLRQVSPFAGVLDSRTRWRIRSGSSVNRAQLEHIIRTATTIASSNQLR
jgi:hypothetical protein